MNSFNLSTTLLLLLLVLDTCYGRWNLASALPRKVLMKKQQQEKPKWHVRMLHKLKLRVKNQQPKKTWSQKILPSAKHLVRKEHKPTMEKKKRNRENKRPMEMKKRRSRETNRDTVKTLPELGDSKTSKHNKKRSKANYQTDCSSFKQTRSIWKRHRDSANADTAYRMAILSSLAYWEFDKWPSANNNMTSFRLLTDNKKPSSTRKSIRQSAQVALCHVASGVSNSNKIVEQHQQQHNNKARLQSCRQVVSRQGNSGYQYDFQWYLHDWHEPTPAGKWHDTDLLVSTSGDNTLVLSFAGTASAADAVTNVQTFEPVGHAGIFNISAGSIHRGFFNAYSRVERGKVSRVCHGDNCNDRYKNTLTRSLHQRYGDCYNMDASATNSGSELPGNKTITKEKKKKRPKCRGRDEKLMFILRELVTTALFAGHKVLLSGHSLGGGIATLMALDIILNFPSVPIHKLHLWTFGAPEVADDLFLHSAMKASPRLKAYILNNRGRRYHRYVTLFDKCKVDVVSTIASKALPSHKRGLHGRIVRRLGGVRGRVVHIAEPHFLPPLRISNSTNSEEDVPTKTGSTIGAHHITSYLQGISRESPSHPLKSNLPANVAEFVGEVSPQKETNVARA